MDGYIYKGNKRLRCGYTTGTCATAAAKAATYMLLTGGVADTIELTVPNGTVLVLKLEDRTVGEDYVSCAVRKDGGDDPDVTSGMLIYARVERIKDGVELDGGEGIGRITRAGLDREIGEAAINSVPQRCIREAVDEVCKAAHYNGGIKVTIYAPEGEERARRTLNSALGIVGGISIIGTTGIVEPMSEAALKDTIALELKQRAAKYDYLAAVPGDYGRRYAVDMGIQEDRLVVMSNYVGETIDYAVDCGVKGMLIIGHIGKMVKLGVGIMNTHSSYADGRLEVLAAAALESGADRELMLRVLGCATTDSAVEVLKESDNLDGTMSTLMLRIDKYLRRRAYAMDIGAVVFSQKYGTLGMTESAEHILALLKKG